MFAMLDAHTSLAAVLQDMVLSFLRATKLYIADQKCVRVMSLADHSATTLVGDPKRFEQHSGCTCCVPASKRPYSFNSLTFAPPGVLYACGAGVVRCIDPSDGSMNTVWTKPSLSVVPGRMFGVVWLDNKLFFSDSDRRAVWSVSPDSGNKQQKLGMRTFMRCLAGGPSGLYFSDGRCILLASFTGRTGERTRLQTLAGNSKTRGHRDGNALEAEFEAVRSMVVDERENVFVADGHCIRLLDRETDTVTTIAGHYKERGYKDGSGLEARFGFPEGIALDPVSGNLYIADSNNNVIRCISDGVVSTVCGQPQNRGFTDGPKAEVQFKSVSALTLDTVGQ